MVHQLATCRRLHLQNSTVSHPPLLNWKILFPKLKPSLEKSGTIPSMFKASPLRSCKRICSGLVCDGLVNLHFRRKDNCAAIFLKPIVDVRERDERISSVLYDSVDKRVRLNRMPILVLKLELPRIGHGMLFYGELRDFLVNLPSDICEFTLSPKDHAPSLLCHGPFPDFTLTYCLEKLAIAAFNDLRVSYVIFEFPGHYCILALSKEFTTFLYQLIAARLF